MRSTEQDSRGDDNPRHKESQGQRKHHHMTEAEEVSKATAVVVESGEGTGSNREAARVPKEGAGPTGSVHAIRL